MSDQCLMCNNEAMSDAKVCGECRWAYAEHRVKELEDVIDHFQQDAAFADARIRSLIGRNAELEELIRLADEQELSHDTEDE